jgi:glycosyltransferase
MKKFSIITLTLNSENTILDNLKSVDSQNYKNLEHICYDGPSTDKTFQILNKYKNKKRKILKSKKLGLYKSLNEAIKISSGEYIGILHSDDIFFKKSIVTNIAKKFQDEKINIIYTNVKIVNKNNIKNIKRNWVSNKKIFENKVFNRTEYTSLLKEGWMPPHTGFFIRKKIFKKIKYNIKYFISADYDFMIKVINKFDGIYYLPLTSTLMRNGGISSKFSSAFLKLKEDLEIIKKNKIGNFFTLLKKKISKINQFYN